ncbi:MAG: neutral/alkaline non-lysosomal ceramidase N-terminal domain-containing protein [Cyclobacteriaceae bacterium]
MIYHLAKGIMVTLLILLTMSTLVFTFIDRGSYQTKPFYHEMQQRLDSLDDHYLPNRSAQEALMGWSKVPIPVIPMQPLAGYGARDPKASTSIHDSVFFKIFVIKKGIEKVALVVADLLIIHPELKRQIASRLPQGWKPEEIYYTASHTHSSVGGWAPGLVGELFAGNFDEDIIDRMAIAFNQGLSEAEGKLSSGSLIGYSKLNVKDMVYNRLAKEYGELDPWFHVLSLLTTNEQSLITSFSAHATCLGRSNRAVSNDYPGILTRQLKSTGNYDIVGFMAGAVGSMGPNVVGEDGWKKAGILADELKNQFDLLELIGIPYQEVSTISSLKLKLPVGLPYFKISKNLAIRPYLFHYFFGEYTPDISILKINNLLLIGMPCDFSGELALPLYKKAEELGMKLIITSFNGDYLGYVIKDEWYDLEKYESRTMSWYGPNMGAYMSDISTRIIEIMYEN